MSAANFATCQFCSKPDDSIQVICESRCLICSRCQLVPVIRKLLIDHTEFSSPSSNSAQNASDNKNTSSFNNNNQSCSAIRGTCPICTGTISSNMLYLIQGFYDSLKADDEEIIGKVNTELVLEETCPVISSFLKRFKASYSDVPQVNLKAFIPSADKDKGKKKNKKDDDVESDSTKMMRMVSGLSLQDVHSGPVKLGIPSVLEFVLDCYCAMWQSLIRCGNESMLAVMMKQVCKKKYSQKTNDFRTKSLLDSLMSAAGTEIPELMVFCNLVGILPKVSGKISAAWGHIATAILAASHCDRCLKYNKLIDGFGNPTVNEFRAKLSKTILFQGYNVSATSANSSKNIPLKKAFRIIQLLMTTYQPSWIMAPMTSACVEYQSRLPWSAASVAKLFNALIYVALFEQTISSRLSALQAENSGYTVSPESSNFGNDPLTGKSMSKTLDKSQQFTSPAGNKVRTSQSLTQSSAISNKQPFQPQQSITSTASPGRRSSIGVEMSMSTTNVTSTQPMRNHRRTNIGLDEANIQRSMKNAGRMEMMKNIDSLICKLWSTSPHPYLFLDPTISPENQLTMMQYMMSYLGNLDVAGTMIPKTTEDSEHSLHISEEPSFISETNEKHHHRHRHHHHHHHHHHPHSQTLHQQHHQNEDLSKQSHPWSHLSPQEQPLHHVRMDLEQALFLADSLSISMYEFILVAVRAWNAEYESIKAELQRVQLLQQRRAAITGHYDTRQAKMTAQERLTITRLLQWYKRGEEIIGIDWDEVEEQSAHHYFPFSLPKSLLMKSRNELQVLTDQVTQSMLSQVAQDNTYYGKTGSAATTKPGVNLNSSKINAYGSLAGLLPNTVQQAENENQEESYLTLLKGISGGTAIQDNLPEDEVRLLVGQVSPREVDDGSAYSQLDAPPSVTSSVELYMLASELERGMGYTNSVFPAFRKQELQMEQAMMRLGIAEGDEFNHRNHDYHDGDENLHHDKHHHKHHHNEEDEEEEEDGFDSSFDEAPSPEKAKEQWRRAKSHTSAHLLNDKVVTVPQNLLNPMRRASSQKSSGMLEGSTSLTDLMDGLLPPLEAPTLDPTLSGGAGTSSQPLNNKPRAMTTILPHVLQKSASSLIIPQRLQSPANGGERPPSGSLVRFQLEKKRLNSANRSEVVVGDDKANLSKKKEDHDSDIGQVPGKKINIVDMIDVDGEVLERSGLTPGLSKTLSANGRHNSSKSRQQDTFILEDTSLNAHPLEDAISSFAPSNRIRSGSKLNRKPVHQVNIDIVADRDTKKYSTKIVVEENFANSSFQQKKTDKNDETDGDGNNSDEKEEKVDPVGHRVGGGTVVHLPPVLNVEERRKFTRARLLSVVDRIAEDYNAVIESQKKARISHVRTKVMQRANGLLEDGKNGPGTNKRMNSKVSLVGTNDSTAVSLEDKGKDKKKSIGGKANDNNDQTDNSTVASDSSQFTDNLPHQVPILSTSSFPTIPENSMSISLSGKEKAEDFLSRPTLDLSNSVHSNGKFVIDLSDSLVAESIVTRLMLRNTTINLPSFKLVVKTYCNPWQMESIRFMDFSGNPYSGGFMAAKALGNAMASYCNLIELNVNGMKLGDSGLQCLLQGIIQGGGHEIMQSLKLQHNDITMATNAVSFLGHFLELKSLDLSHNMFTLDTHAQTKFFTEALEGLISLEVISLAYNKIQDKGFSLVLDLLVGQVPLRVLDVAGCFITNFSLEHIRMILLATPKTKDKRYTTTLSMSLALDAQANPGRPPLLRGFSRFLHSSNTRDSTDFPHIEVPSNTRETSAYQPAAAPIQLGHLLMQESLIPQNVWDGLRDMMLASSCRIYLHEAYSGGIDQFPVFDISEFHV